MALNLTPPDISELKPRITVFGVGGAGGNAVNNMITAGLQGVDFVVANTDAQALLMSEADIKLDIGRQRTRGLGAGSDPEVGRESAEEHLEEIQEVLKGADMVFIVEARHRVVRLRLQPRLRDPPGGERLEDRETSATGEAMDQRRDKDGLAGA